MNHLFLFIETTTLWNYADDNTMYYSNKNANIVVSRLRHDFAVISKRFYKTYMVLNVGKCHFLTVGFNEPFCDFSFNDITTGNVTKEKILGILIDIKLNFKSHLKNMYKKTNQELSALSRISKLTTLNPLQPGVAFLYPLKTSENLKVFRCFQGV